MQKYSVGIWENSSEAKAHRTRGSQSLMSPALAGGFFTTGATFSFPFFPITNNAAVNIVVNMLITFLGYCYRFYILGL